MEDALARAQHYLELAVQMHKAAKTEQNKQRHDELMDLAGQYEKLAEKMFKVQQADKALAGLSTAMA